jgi:energy-coupling factor transport system substrate-specific component
VTINNSIDSSQSPPTSRFRWRVVDIVVAAVLGVACGLIYFGWSAVYGPLNALLKVAIPGLDGLLGGMWLLGGVLGGLIIRRPGAALFVELVAALVPALIGNQWGTTTLVSGILQGLGAEIVFAIFLYKRWKLPVAVLAGVLAAAFEWCFEIIVWYPENTLQFKGLYLLFLAISGAVLAGVLGWLLAQALARTGALDRFESGREVRKLV